MLQPGTVVGRYVVDHVIGRGGMADVYQVRDEVGAPWALKLLTMRKDDVRDRFRREAEIQVALDHPHIVRARELLDVDDEPALVMEFVDGATLDAWQAAHPLATLVEKDRIARQVVDAVAHAHAQGLVHRDLKPGNVMVSDRPEGPWCKVTDFGLAKVLDGLAATRTGVALGTPRYMAPEQIRDAKRVDARADVWSLGVLLYELYTGRAPFHRDVVIDVFTAVVTGDYADPARFGVPDRVRDAIRGALQVDPAARFGDCRALLAALGAEPSIPPGTWALPVLGSPIIGARPVPSVPPRAVEPASTTLSPPSDPAPSDPEPSAPDLRSASQMGVFPARGSTNARSAATRRRRSTRTEVRPWPVQTWILAWTGSLVLVLALFVAAVVAIAVALAVGG